MEQWRIILYMPRGCQLKMPRWVIWNFHQEHCHQIFLLKYLNILVSTYHMYKRWKLSRDRHMWNTLLHTKGKMKMKKKDQKRWYKCISNFSKGGTPFAFCIIIDHLPTLWEADLLIPQYTKISEKYILL